MRLCLAALLVLLVAGPASAEPFQGTAVFHAVLSDGKSFDFKLSQLGTRMRHEMMAASGVPMSVGIYDQATGQMTMMMPAQKKFMVMNVSQMGMMHPGAAGAPQAQPDTAVTVTPTGQKATIAGIACEGYVVQSKKAKVEVCAARGLGMFSGLQGGQGPSSSLSAFDTSSPALAKFAKDGFFPLRMVITSEDGKGMTWEATSVDRKKPDASLFAPPADYTSMETSRMPPH